MSFLLNYCYTELYNEKSMARKESCMISLIKYLQFDNNICARKYLTVN